MSGIKSVLVVVDITLIWCVVTMSTGAELIVKGCHSSRLIRGMLR